MAVNKTKTDRVPVTFPKELTQEVDAYASLNKQLTSRSKVIRHLVREGLESEYKKSSKLRSEVKSIMETTKEN